MPREDYEAIAKIVEDVIGKDTLSCIKILEGIKFYLDNKVNKIKIVKTDTESMFKVADISQHTKAAERAMKNYTERLRKENERYKKQNCTTTS
tara:strand:- start:849 stop:1127 length:279 start_codon:yes stop_codon:yes gene_type:complete